MSDTLTIAIVDDHPFYRDGVMRALQKARGIRIVGTGGSAEDAVRIVAEQKPDILLLDIGLPEGKQCLARVPWPRVLDVVPDLLLDAGMFPQRFYVSKFPSAEQLARMGG